MPSFLKKKNNLISTDFRIKVILEFNYLKKQIKIKNKTAAYRLETAQVTLIFNHREQRKSMDISFSGDIFIKGIPRDNC